VGFGHRVYKHYDPRARIIKEACDKVLASLSIVDPLLDIARELEEAALRDDYFVERHLYPNVDFYSGIIYRAIGIPSNMFTVMFALGRLPGWIAHWKEMWDDPNGRIGRPRQLYVGPKARPFVPIAERVAVSRGGEAQGWRLKAQGRRRVRRCAPSSTFGAHGAPCNYRLSLLPSALSLQPSAGCARRTLKTAAHGHVVFAFAPVAKGQASGRNHCSFGHQKRFLKGSLQPLRQSLERVCSPYCTWLPWMESATPT